MTPRVESSLHPPSDPQSAIAGAGGADAVMIDQNLEAPNRFIIGPTSATEERASLTLRRLVNVLARQAAHEIWTASVAGATANEPGGTDHAN
jgi:hypothetical protein